KSTRRDARSAGRRSHGTDSFAGQPGGPNFGGLWPPACVNRQSAHAADHLTDWSPVLDLRRLGPPPTARPGRSPEGYPGASRPVCSRRVLLANRAAPKPDLLSRSSAAFIPAPLASRCVRLLVPSAPQGR